MTTKDLIEAEINGLTEEELEKVYRMVKGLSPSKRKTSKPSLMARLRNIRIDAPQDFAANFDRPLELFSER
ncbi:hypothetical protein FJY63_03405 [Candidatus Sumerlaeota bacterium]|nr:hypothetical protein [Candidatus Sumerlaeota bacterium]